MGTSFSPYLHFHGNAAEAMATYGAIFGGSPDIVTFGQFGGADPAIAGQVMHSSLRAGPGLLIMASDTPSEMGGGYDVAGNTSVAVISDGADPADDATLTGWWDALSDGATIIAPLAEAPWGGKFGMLTDRFGVRWMFDITAVGTGVDAGAGSPG